MAASGYFKDANQAAQAVVKILAGHELGFGPFASMKGVYIIQGGPSLSANLMAAAVKRSGRYNYRVIEMTNDVCTIAFFEGRDEIGRSSFTKEDAAKAGTQNMGKFPRNMLFARAMSNGCRWFCPDVFNGSQVYTPEELGAQVNEEGDVIDIQPTETTAADDEITKEKKELLAAFEVNSSMGKLGTLNLEQLYEQRKNAEAVPEKNRTAKYKAAADALAKVIEYREWQAEEADNAARAEMTEGTDE